jgi:hypothetical protein
MIEGAPMAYSDPPTQRQQTYLRQLAERTGQTFAVPRTRAEASREIERLERTEPSAPFERRGDRHAVSHERRAEPYGARVRDDEVRGYGSSATWA